MNRSIRLTLAGMIVLLGCAPLGWAQSVGSISGTIQDATGAVVPNASVTIANTGTNVASHVLSLSDGKYLADNLTPGKYEITVEAPGFKRSVRSGIDVHVSDKIDVNFVLELGQTRETVTVTAESPLLRTQDAQTGEVVDNNFISNMPQLNRNPFALVNLSADVSGTGTSLQINGGRTASIDYYVDGGVINSGQANQLTNQQPSMDAVAEFKVVTSGISAEFGRISGGYVTLVTKSGTNTFHGSLYEYMFNDMFNANTWAQNAVGAPKAHFRQNDYGFTLGGPVRIPKVYNGSNRMFFFVDNEYLVNNGAGTINLSSVPNDRERAGDFSQTYFNGKQYVAYDPNGPQVFNSSNGLWQRTGLLGGDGLHVPQSLISPVSTAILKLVPEPNRPSVAGSSSLNNYAWANSNALRNFRFGVKLDYNLTDNQRLSFRYSTYDSNQAIDPTMNSPLYTSNVVQSNGGMNNNLNYTWTKSPTTIIALRASVTFSPGLTGSVHAAGLNNSFLPAIYQNYLGTNTVPLIRDTFMSGTALAQADQQAVMNSTDYNYAGTLTKVFSGHTLKFGGEARRYYDNFINAGTSNIMDFMVDPLYQFQGDWGLGAIQGRVLGMESFLLGVNDRNNVAQPTSRAMNTNYYAGFVQDDWKVSPKLTINLGLRYDNERPTTERHNKLYFWDPSQPSFFPVISGYNFAAAVKAAGLPANTPVPGWATTNSFQPGAVMIAGTPEFPSRSPQIVSNTQFAPRVGIAYQIDNKTVVRAYGGKMYLPTTGNPNSYGSSNANVALSNQAFAGWHASTDGGRTYISTWANPFPLQSMFTTYTRDVKTANLQSSLDPGANVVSQELHQPREYDWSFSIQRELPANNIVEIGYVANRGLGLLATDTISHYPASLLQPQYAAMMQQPVASPNAGETLETTITGSIQQLGLLEYTYPYYGRVQVSGLNEGTSRYQAMTIRLDHQFSYGMSVLANYTWSQLMDDVGGPDGQGGKTVQSIDSFHQAWSLSPLDHTHRLNIAYTYQFPFGKGRHWLRTPNGLGGKVLDYIAGGWQFAGNYTYTTGAPVILTGSTTSNINNGIKVNQTWGSYATSDHNLINPAYTGDSQVLYGPLQPITSSSIGWLNPAAVVGARAFISGNLPPTDGRYRNPSFSQLDVSFQKNFRIRESMYFQLRAEGQNALNIRGFGPYNTSIGTPNYGLITTAGNIPRQIQLSARINF